jgi:anaerobic magnesium-protoporphyrin IX monomethyl ester cyclase
MFASTETYKKYSDFKVLFLYPNLVMSALAPQGIGYLSAILKQEGFTVDLFDTTFYTSDLSSNVNDEKVYLSKVRPFDWGERNIHPKTSDMLDDLQKKVDEFQPDLLALSVVENTWHIADTLLRSLLKPIPTIVGGVFPTYAPEIVISHPRVNYVCRGEGEYALLNLCKALCQGKVSPKLPNLWTKVDGNIYKSSMGESIPLDELPFPDWSIFEEQSLYRPMQGKIYRTLGLETQRGCPYKCTFCNSPSNNEIYTKDNAGSFYRKKSLKRVAQELEFMVKNYDPEFIYMVVDTFLAISDREMAELSEIYQSFKIPFWMNTRPETLNEWRAQELDKMNCMRINMGIEHGNEKFRRDVLKRPVTNESILKSFQACSGRNFVTISNSIIGYPDETRELIFDTIRLNQKLPKDVETSGAFIFTPYYGTLLRELAVQKGYIREDNICSSSVMKGSILDMPQLSQDKIRGLVRVFSFYVGMPENRYDEIQTAENFDPEGEKAFKKLHNEFKLKNIETSDESSDETLHAVSPMGGKVINLDSKKERHRSGHDFADLH